MANANSQPPAPALALRPRPAPVAHVCAVLQGTSIWVRYTKMQRYFLPQYNALERTLVAMNFVQNVLFFFVVNTPLLLRVAHEVLFGTGIPLTGLAKQVLGYAVLLQLCYDAYWTTRLWNSFFRCGAGGSGMHS